MKLSPNVKILSQALPKIGVTLLFFLLLLSSSNLAFAQNDFKPEVSLWGIFQPRVSYGSMENESVERFGFGVRRARIRVEVALQNRIGVRYDADLASGSLQSVDLFAFYRLSPRAQVRFGVMASAQPRAHIFTPLPLIDGFDRAAIAEQWAGATLGGGGRDFGIDFQYQTPEWTFVGFLHNGDGSFDRSRGNFAQTISSESATRNVDRTSLATSLYLAHRPTTLPGVEIGGYLSQNPSENPNTRTSAGVGRKYFSYAAHIYYGAAPGSQPVRLKLDLIGINYDGPGDVERLGVSVLGAFLLNPYMEIFGRYENIQQDTRIAADDVVSAGISFSLSKFYGGNFSDQRATFGYSFLDSVFGSQQHLFVLQWQLVL